MRNLYPSDDAPEYYQAVKDAIADAKKLTSEDVRFPIQKRSGEIDTKMVKILQEKKITRDSKIKQIVKSAVKLEKLLEYHLGRH